MDSGTVTITHDAARRVRHLIDTRGNPGLKLRVYVQGGGCSGFQYGFRLEEQQGDDDFTIEEGGVTVLVDALSYQYLMGSQIDFKNDLQGARFMVKNPNASATCGCGSSFSI